MKYARRAVSWVLGVLLALGFVACLTAALCDRKAHRVGTMILGPR